MPELPEVEVTLRGISKVLTQATIQQIIVSYPTLREPISTELATLKNLRVVKLERRAKYILIHTDQGVILLHLGMSGHLRVAEQTEEARKHDHVTFILDNGFQIFFNDARRFGLCVWFPLDQDPYESSWLKKLGPEPLTDAFNGEILFKKITTRKTSIKVLLMDNTIVVGVGNIYASEVLFAAGISPLRSGNEISLAECNKLATEIKRILAESISQGGTTIRDFSGADGKPGYFVQNLSVYGHGNEPCPHCGSMIKSKVIGGRNTYFCEHCQH